MLPELVSAPTTSRCAAGPTEIAPELFTATPRRRIKRSAPLTRTVPAPYTSGSGRHLRHRADRPRRGAGRAESLNGMGKADLMVVNSRRDSSASTRMLRRKDPGRRRTRTRTISLASMSSLRALAGSEKPRSPACVISGTQAERCALPDVGTTFCQGRKGSHVAPVVKGNGALVQHYRRHEWGRPCGSSNVL